METEKLILTYKDGELRDQFARLVVNHEAIFEVIKRPLIDGRCYEWSGTYELITRTIYVHDFEGVDSEYEETVVRLIPPVASEPQTKDADKFKRLRSDIARFQQTLIARNYNNIGQWHNERQQYNFELIEEVTKILIDNQP